MQRTDKRAHLVCEDRGDLLTRVASERRPQRLRDTVKQMAQHVQTWRRLRSVGETGKASMTLLSINGETEAVKG